jgi:hypothetical protein
MFRRRSYNFERLQYNRQVSSDLIAVTLFLRFAKIGIGSGYLTFPLPGQFWWDYERAVGLPLALAVHVPLPMRPALVFHTSKGLHQFV